MEEPLLGKSKELAKAQKESRSVIKKNLDFFILFNSTGVDGSPLQDAVFAARLKQKLEQEVKVNGERSRVAMADAATGCGDVEAMLRRMSRSFIIMVVFSEATLQTFAGDAHAHMQNNYLLMLQLVSSLSDEGGIRMIGLNLMAIEQDPEESRHFRCEGWRTQFSDVPQSNAWTEQSIKKTMDRVFAIQGIDIDPEDWEYRLPELTGSLNAFQDEISASGWISVFSIIPWRSIRSVFFTFICSCLCCCSGPACTKLMNRKAPMLQKNSLLNVSIFASGLAFVVIGFGLLITGAINATPAKLCQAATQCELQVMSGNLWALWQKASDSCPIICSQQWSSSFSHDCAQCVCTNLKFLDKACANQEIQQSAFVTMGVVWVLGALIIAWSISRLNPSSALYNHEARQQEKSRIEIHTL